MMIGRRRCAHEPFSIRRAFDWVLIDFRDGKLESAGVSLRNAR